MNQIRLYTPQTFKKVLMVGWQLAEEIIMSGYERLRLEFWYTADSGSLALEIRF